MALPLGRYAVDRGRNDLGLVFFVTLDKHGPLRREAVPLKLEYCHTRLADCEEADWVRHRFRTPSAVLGRPAAQEEDRVVVVRRSSSASEKSPRPWTRHKAPQLRCSSSALVTPRSPRQHRDTL
jgi:hypothetical protein